MNIEEAQHRYLHDPEFKALVMYMEHTIINLKYSPSELRDAAMFAHIRVMNMNLQPTIMRMPKAEFDSIFLATKTDLASKGKT